MTPITIEEIAYHRNGVSGHGFHVVTFLHERRAMVAVLFAAPGQCAVFNRDQLGRGIIAFMQNSWRGDVFEDALRTAIAAYRYPHEMAGEDPPPQCTQQEHPA